MAEVLRRSAIAAVAIAVLFAAVVLVDVSFLTVDEACRAWLLGRGAGIGGAVAVLLLAADVLLPTVSHVLMIYLGRAFGLGGGAVLTVLGTTLATLLGIVIGRTTRGGGARGSASGALLLIAVTRPVPVLAEAVILGSASAGVSAKRILAGALAGNVPLALLYAWLGATSTSWETGWLTLGGTTLLSLALATWARSRLTQEDVDAPSP